MGGHGAVPRQSASSDDDEPSEHKVLPPSPLAKNPPRHGRFRSARGKGAKNWRYRVVEERETAISKAIVLVIKRAIQRDDESEPGGEFPVADAEGWVSVGDVLAHSRLAKLDATVADVQRIVSNAIRRRFDLRQTGTPDGSDAAASWHISLVTSRDSAASHAVPMGDKLTADSEGLPKFVLYETSYQRYAHQLALRAIDHAPGGAPYHAFVPVSTNGDVRIGAGEAAEVRVWIPLREALRTRPEISSYRSERGLIVTADEIPTSLWGKAVARRPDIGLLFADGEIKNEVPKQRGFGKAKERGWLSATSSTQTGLAGTASQQDSDGDDSSDSSSGDASSSDSEHAKHHSYPEGEHERASEQDRDASAQEHSYDALPERPLHYRPSRALEKLAGTLSAPPPLIFTAPEGKFGQPAERVGHKSKALEEAQSAAELGFPFQVESRQPIPALEHSLVSTITKAGPERLTPDAWRASISSTTQTRSAQLVPPVEQTSARIYNFSQAARGAAQTSVSNLWGTSPEHRPENLTAPIRDTTSTTEESPMAKLRRLATPAWRNPIATERTPPRATSGQPTLSGSYPPEPEHGQLATPAWSSPIATERTPPQATSGQPALSAGQISSSTFGRYPPELEHGQPARPVGQTSSVVEKSSSEATPAFSSPRGYPFGVTGTKISGKAQDDEVQRRAGSASPGLGHHPTPRVAGEVTPDQTKYSGRISSLIEQAQREGTSTFPSPQSHRFKATTPQQHKGYSSPQTASAATTHDPSNTGVDKAFKPSDLLNVTTFISTLPRAEGGFGQLASPRSKAVENVQGKPPVGHPGSRHYSKPKATSTTAPTAPTKPAPGRPFKFTDILSATTAPPTISSEGASGLLDLPVGRSSNLVDKARSKAASGPPGSREHSTAGVTGTTATPPDSSERALDTLLKHADTLRAQPAPPTSPQGKFEQLTALAGLVSDAARKVRSGAASGSPSPGDGSKPGATGSATSGEAGDYDEMQLPDVNTPGYRTELNHRLNSESTRTHNFRDLFFSKNQLPLPTSVYQSISVLGQKATTAAITHTQNSLLDLLSGVPPGSTLDDSTTRTALEILHDGNKTVKDLLRQYLLESAAFHDKETLKLVSQSKNKFASDEGLVADAALRARNINCRPHLFPNLTDAAGGSGGEAHRQCSLGAGTGVVEQESGEVKQGGDEQDDGFLRFPGHMNGIFFEPLIDTGGGCNLISSERLKELKSDPSSSASRFKTLILADGSKSDKCPCIKVTWSFEGRNKEWNKVEFVVVKGYRHGVLIGLPFLKHSQTIHNSAGRLVFPEYKGVNTNQDGVPIYDFRVQPKR